MQSLKIMNSILSKYKYSYTDSNLHHHYDYLLALLKQLLSRFKDKCHHKLQVLALGCENDSLTNLADKKK